MIKVIKPIKLHNQNDQNDQNDQDFQIDQTDRNDHFDHNNHNDQNFLHTWIFRSQNLIKVSLALVINTLRSLSKANEVTGPLWPLSL